MNCLTTASERPKLGWASFPMDRNEQILSKDLPLEGWVKSPLNQISCPFLQFLNFWPDKKNPLKFLFLMFFL